MEQQTHRSKFPALLRERRPRRERMLWNNERTPRPTLDEPTTHSNPRHPPCKSRAFGRRHPIRLGCNQSVACRYARPDDHAPRSRTSSAFLWRPGTLDPILGSIYAFQADFRITDDNRVPVHNSGRHQRYCWQLARPRRQGSRVGSNRPARSSYLVSNVSWFESVRSQSETCASISQGPPPLRGRLPFSD